MYCVVFSEEHFVSARNFMLQAVEGEVNLEARDKKGRKDARECWHHVANVIITVILSLAAGGVPLM